MHNKTKVSSLQSRPRAVGRGKLPASLLLLLLGRHHADVHAFALAPSAAITSVSTSSFIGTLDVRVAALSRALNTRPVNRCLSRELPYSNRCSCRCSSEGDHVPSRSKQAFAIGTSSSRSSSNNNRRMAFARSSTKLLAEPEDSQGGPSEEGEAPAREGAASDGEIVENSLGEGGVGSQQQQLPEVVNPFKLAFDAGRNLRATLAKNLEQITGTASPVSLRFCVLCSAMRAAEEAHIA